MMSPGEYIFRCQLVPTAAAAPKDEEEVEPRKVLSKRRGSVAARLRNLPTVDPLSKRHPRSINEDLEL